MSDSSNDDIQAFGDISRETLDSSDAISYAQIAQAGITESVVRQISVSGNEPAWMLEHRLKSLQYFQSCSIPTWGPSLEKLDLNSIYYFAKPE